MFSFVLLLLEKTSQRKWSPTFLQASHHKLHNSVTDLQFTLHKGSGDTELAAHSNTSELLRRLLLAASRLIIFIYLDDCRGVLNNVNYSYILEFGFENSNLRISSVWWWTAPKAMLEQQRQGWPLLQQPPLCSPTPCGVQLKLSHNWLKPCFVLSGNTDKAKMAWNQQGKECVNEWMRQRGKDTEHYVVGKKWT